MNNIQPPGNVAAPDAPQAPSSATPQRSRLRLLAALPIPLFLLALVALWAADARGSYESPFLLLGLNLVFSLLVSLFVACLIGWSFLIHPTPGLLLLGCGVIIWGSAGVMSVVAGISGTAGHPLDSNLTLTVHNLCVWLSALCHLVSAIFSYRLKRKMRAAALWLAAAYTLAFGAVGLVTLAALAHWTPLFFVQGCGGTLVRFLVLGSAIAMFVLTVAILRAGKRKPLSLFVDGYTLALGLISIGLFGVLMASAPGSLLSWTGRAAQFLSGGYMLVAALSLVRKSGLRGLILQAVLNPRRYRYGVAVVIVLSAAAVRLVCLQMLETRLPYLTFYPAVMLAALYGGLRAGLLATALSAFLADFFWIDPVWYLSIQNPADCLSMVIFILICTAFSWLAEAMQLAQARALRAEAQVQLAAERQRATEGLRESEERHRIFFEMGAVGMAYGSLEGRILHANTKYCEITGYPLAELTQLNFFDLTHPDDLEKDREDYRHYIQEERPIYATDKRYVCKDGSVCWVAVTARILRDAVGQPICSIGIIQDITERKLAEEALRVSEERFRITILNSPVNVSNQDLELRYTWICNPQLRLAVEDVVGKTDFDLLPTETAHQVDTLKREVLATGTRRRAEVPILIGTETFYYDFTIEPLRDARGGIIGVTNVVIDITEHKHTEMALRESEQLYRAIGESIDYGIWVCDADGQNTYASSSFLKLIGKTQEDCSNSAYWGDILHPEDVEQTVAAWKECVRTGEIFDMEFRCRGVDGQWHPILARGMPIRDEQGRITKWAGINLDISRLKKARHALQDAQSRLKTHAENLEKTVAERTARLWEQTAERERLQEELLKISEREKQLIAQELHDGLCQHLAGTALMGTLLHRNLATRQDPLADQAKEICDLLSTGVHEARNLSHGLHPVKDKEEGLMEALSGLAQTVTKLFHVQCAFCRDDDVLVHSQTAATHLFRIAQEAVNNAVKHGQASKVLITLKNDCGEVSLSIRDNGIGVPRKLPANRGMGMQIMNHRAETIGAWLVIRRASKRGTVVTCTLPARGETGGSSRSSNPQGEACSPPV